MGSAWTTIHLMNDGEREVAEILGIPYDKVTQGGLFPIAYTIGTDFKPAKREPLAKSCTGTGGDVTSPRASEADEQAHRLRRRVEERLVCRERVGRLTEQADVIRPNTWLHAATRRTTSSADSVPPNSSPMAASSLRRRTGTSTSTPRWRP